MKKKVLISLFFLLVVTVLGVWFYKGYLKEMQSLDIVTNEPGLTLWDINYVKNAKGKPVWSLRVDSAVKNEITGVLEGDGVRLTIYKRGKPLVFLTAQKGLADVKKGIFQVWGDVFLKMEDDNCSLTTDKIQYDDKKKRILSSSDVSFQCQGLQLSGQGLVVDLNSGSLQIDGAVMAVLD